jgi:hypothetical protein
VRKEINPYNKIIIIVGDVVEKQTMGQKTLIWNAFIFANDSS